MVRLYFEIRWELLSPILFQILFDPKEDRTLPDPPQKKLCLCTHQLVFLVVVLYLSVGTTELNLMEYPIEYLLPKLVSSCLRGLAQSRRAGFPNEEVRAWAYLSWGHNYLE